MKIAILLLALLILGSIVGCIVGVFTGRPDVAVAVATGVFALVTVIQSLIAWLTT
jgi:hypothetical protein